MIKRRTGCLLSAVATALLATAIIVAVNAYRNRPDNPRAAAKYREYFTFPAHNIRYACGDMWTAAKHDRLRFEIERRYAWYLLSAGERSEGVRDHIPTSGPSWFIKRPSLPFAVYRSLHGQRPVHVWTLSVYSNDTTLTVFMDCYVD